MSAASFQIQCRSISSASTRNSRSLHCATPHFLFRSVALANFLRLPLREAAYVAAGAAAMQESGSAPVGMTILFGYQHPGPQTNLSSRPERSAVEGPAVYSSVRPIRRPQIAAPHKSHPPLLSSRISRPAVEPQRSGVGGSAVSVNRARQGKFLLVIVVVLAPALRMRQHRRQRFVAHRIPPQDYIQHPGIRPVFVRKIHAARRLRTRGLGPIRLV